MRAISTLLLLLAALATISFSTAAAATELCLSQGNRFPRFALEGRAPRKSPRGADDIRLCRIYSSKTCCAALQSQHALAALRNLATNGEGSRECMDLWEVLECSVCDPRVGTSPGPPTLCRSFCDAVFRACSSAFFAMDHSKQALLPCGSSEVICAEGTEWTRNSSHFCELAGFRVAERLNGDFCFDGTVEDSSTTEPSARKKKPDRASTLRGLRKNFDRSSLMEDKVLWAIAGLVLTAGVMYLRRRGSRSRARRVAMLKNLKEARASQQAELNRSTSTR